MDDRFDIMDILRSFAQAHREAHAPQVQADERSPLSSSVDRWN